MWHPIKNYKLRRDWRLVSTLQAHYTSDDKKIGDVYYYLFENGLGKRKCEHDGSGYASGNANYIKKIRTSHPHYLAKIRPWLAGQFDPGIPNYESIKAKEFKDNLAGKIT